MITETPIAVKNIREFKYCKVGEAVYYKWICDSHKESCQRFLEFLERYYLQYKTINIKLGYIQEKITDLKNAIKLYNENGIQTRI